MLWKKSSFSSVHVGLGRMGGGAGGGFCSSRQHCPVCLLVLRMHTWEQRGRRRRTILNISSPSCLLQGPRETVRAIWSTDGGANEGWGLMREWVRGWMGGEWGSEWGGECDPRLSGSPTKEKMKTVSLLSFSSFYSSSTPYWFPR